jgi:hypothetical protein
MMHGLARILARPPLRLLLTEDESRIIPRRSHGTRESVFGLGMGLCSVK